MPPETSIMFPKVSALLCVDADNLRRSHFVREVIGGSSPTNLPSRAHLDRGIAQIPRILSDY